MIFDFAYIEFCEIAWYNQRIRRITNKTMATLMALCMKCRDEKNKPTMREMTNVVVEEKNGRYSAKGKCSACGGNQFKFLSKADADALKG